MNEVGKVHIFRRLAYLLIASFSVALRRAWSLLQGKHLPLNEDT